MTSEKMEGSISLARGYNPIVRPKAVFGDEDFTILTP
jgi:hypothetical protein